MLRKFITKKQYLLLSLLFVASVEARTVNVAVIKDGDTQGLAAIEQIFKQELLDLTKGEFDVRFVQSPQYNANWSTEGARNAIQRAQSSPNVDMVLALGFVSSLIAAESPRLNKPTFAPLVLDAKLFNLPLKDNNTSGKNNLNYITEGIQIEEDFRTFQSVVPFKKLGLVVDSSIFNAVSAMSQQARVLAQTGGIELVFILEDQSGPLIDKVPEDIDAVMIAALPRLSEQQHKQFFQALINKGVPSYSLMGARQVKEGLLMTRTPDSDWKRLARKNALHMQSALLGQNPATMGVLFQGKRQLTINMATARALGVSPKFDILARADLLNEDIVDENVVWSLAEVARSALISNLDVLSGEQGLKASAEIQKQAKALLLPQLNSGINYTVLDPDTGTVLAGTQAKNTTSGNISLGQIIYSEPTLANVDIARENQTAAEAIQEQLELDIIQQATVAFLNVLVAQTNLDVQRSSLESSKSNLSLAKDRVALGVTTAADVYRWESEVATSTQTVLSAKAQVDQAKDNLNLLLDRPIGQRFATTPATLKDPSLLISHDDLLNVIDNQKTLDRFGELMITAGIEQSPELKQVYAQIAANQRQLKSNQRAFWQPQVNLTGEVDEVFSESGEIMNSREGDSNWRVAVNLTYPIFEGGARRSRLRQTQYQDHQLRLQRDSVTNTVETLVRRYLHDIRASYPSIELAQIASEASQKNYELVQDKYNEGAASIVDLLNARDDFLAAQQRATNAVNEFLIDLMNLQRSSGSFDFFLDEQQTQVVVDEIKAYVNESYPE